MSQHASQNASRHVRMGLEEMSRAFSEPTPFRLSIEQYDAMIATGAFDQFPQRIQLIRGELQMMNPAGPIHADLVECLTRWSFRCVDDSRIHLRVQSGLRLSKMASEPEPDLMWLAASRPRYRHPIAAEARLLIEVADSSLDYDLTTKAQLYAEADIPEYWVVDIRHRQVHVFRQPSQSGYEQRVCQKVAGTVAPLVEPAAQLELADLFDF